MRPRDSICSMSHCHDHILSQGFYTGNSTAATTCSRCEDGKSSETNSVDCDICQEDYFLNPRNSDQCSACPDDASCDGGTLLPIPDPGFYVDRSKAKFGDIVMRCPLGRKACNAEKITTCWSLGNFSDESQCPTDLVCNPGYTGPLCKA